MKINNKYSKWYYNLIEKAKTANRFKGDGEYYEEHHIRPKSLGGEDTVDNLVLLTAKEHFVAHILLFKMLEGSQKKAMLRALVRMLSNGYNGRTYEHIRKLISKHSKGENNPAYGKIWIYNPETKDRKFVYMKEFELLYSKQNYIKGLDIQIGGFKKGSKIKINNGITEKMINIGSPIPDGWKIGRLCSPTKDHMIKMHEIRKEKGGYAKHSESLTGRILITDGKGNNKRIHPEDLEKYEKQGFYKGWVVTKNTIPVSINNIRYECVSEVLTKLPIKRETVHYRLKSKLEKWKDWYYINN